MKKNEKSLKNSCRIAASILGKDSGDATDAVQDATIATVRSSAIDNWENIDEIHNISSGHPPDHDSGEIIEHIIDSLPSSQQHVIKLSAFRNLSNE